jgi:hypothetical protein
MGNGKVSAFFLWRYQSMLTWMLAGIRNFVVGVTVKVASDENTLRKEKTYINKLNLALVQVRSTIDLLYLVTDIFFQDTQARMATQLAFVHL